MERNKENSPDMPMIPKHSRRGSMRWLNIWNVREVLGHGCSNASPDLEEEQRRSSSSEKDDMPSVSLNGGWSSEVDDNGNRERPGTSSAVATSTAADGEKLRMFVGTWNVGGRAPHAGLNLRDWLCTPALADIYVLGFQEVVPLNAGNILIGEDRGPASTWLSLIGQALNVPEIAPTSAGNDGGGTIHPDRFRRPRVCFCDLISIEDMLEEEAQTEGKRRDRADSRPEGIPGRCGYYPAASKQMVGIFLCVWVRADLLPHVHHVKSSCVARGMLGYTGNKGSISISMTLWQTTFCFVCTHLASGEKEKDEVRRNLDVVEILKKTRFFSQSKRRALPEAMAPKTILEHSKIIWLGDLNYRLSSSCEDTSKLLQKNDWDALLEKDQLKIEQKSGRIFTGWNEGRIYFPPTYKYLTNSDRYVVQTEEARGRKRAPAWCDRILWRGQGMKQVCYVRGESMFSDHRPVFSVFSVQLSRAEHNDMASLTTTESKSWRRKKIHELRWSARSENKEANNEHSRSSNSSGANLSSRVQAEEMFPIAKTESCTENSHS